MPDIRHEMTFEITPDRGSCPQMDVRDKTDAAEETQEQTLVDDFLAADDEALKSHPGFWLFMTISETKTKDVLVEVFFHRRLVK